MTEIADGEDFYDEGYEDDDRSVNNRVTFPRDKFYGRQKELSTLHGLYARLCSQRNVPSSEESLLAAESPVAIICGYSGAGKSSLVARFIEELDRRKKEGNAKDFLFLTGKFEEMQNSDPLSTITDAFNGLCRFLLQETERERLGRIQGAIDDSLGADAAALTSVIPDIKGVLTTAEGSALTSSNASDMAWNRLQYLFQKLLKSLCHDDCPLILFLDDIQWADAASISLLRALLKDVSLKNFMFIGAARGEEMDQEHPVSKLLAETEQVPGKEVERIDLLNLSMRDIGHFLSDSLNLSAEECEPLTEFVFGRTRGNIFFAMQMVEELERLNLLYYSVISFRWEWNLEGADIHVGLSDTLDDAVAGKIQNAPEKLQRALVLASYTRSVFHVNTVQVLMAADGNDLTREELVRLLDLAVLEGFLLNTMGSWMYRFAHDRIQQAAYSLVKAGSSRDTLRLMIGNELFILSTKDEGEDWMLFVAADHLNSCSIRGGDPLQLARLNLCCGEKANLVAAYVPASVYLRLAMKYLRKIDNHWATQYDLSLRIFRALCDVELCIGNFDSGDELAREVIRMAQNLNDRLPTFLSLAIAKGRQDQHVEAYELCQNALLEMKAVPKRHRTMHILKDNYLIKRNLKKYSDYDILLFPRLTNERKKAVVQFLAEAQLRAYYCGNMLEYMFCCLRSLRIAFKYGLSAASAYAFAAYGLFLDSVCGDHQGALRMARLARQILTRVEDAMETKSQKALTYTVISYYIEAWSCSRDHVLSTGHLAHQAGMESGNVEIGFLNWVIANVFAYATGYPLDPVEKSGREILQQLQLYRANSVLPIFQQVRLPIRVFLGKEENGPDWDELATFSPEQDNKSDTYRSSFGYLGRLEMALFFGKLDLAEKMSDGLQAYLSHEASYLIVTKNIFYRGLVYSGRARKGGALAGRYRSKAVALSKEMEKLSRTKGLNPLHKSMVMKADILACSCTDMARISRAYDEGIGAAMKLGYVQDAALASELAGEFFLSMFDHARARQYICQARDLYHEWGATAKVEHILKRRPVYVDSSMLEETAVSIGTHPAWVSTDGSRNTVDLDLLSGPIPKTELPDMPSSAGDHSVSRDKDEISILTDPSVGHGSQTFNAS